MRTLRRRGRRTEAQCRFIEDLYDSHAPALLSWFLRRTMSEAVAADLCAETFSVVIEQVDRFDPERGEPGAWLFGIARNQLRRYLRSSAVEHRMRRRVAITMPTVSDGDFDLTDERLDAVRSVRGAQVALAALAEGTSAAIELRVMEGLPYHEVALRLGCTVGAARVRVSRGLVALHGELEQEVAFDDA